MEIEEETMITKTVYSKDREHRYLLSKEWNTKLKSATIIMLNPATANTIAIDMTTMYIINHMQKLDYGSVEIVNIFSKLNEEITVEIDIEKLTNDTNNKAILSSIAKTDITILAWGKSGKTNKKVNKRIQQVQELIKGYEDKLYEISDKKGISGWHPLSPRIRHEWQLVKVAPFKQEVKSKRTYTKTKKTEKELS